LEKKRGGPKVSRENASGSSKGDVGVIEEEMSKQLPKKEGACKLEGLNLCTLREEEKRSPHKVGKKDHEKGQSRIEVVT